MHRYYTGPLKKVVAKNAVKNSNGSISYDKEVEIIDNKMSFYENFFGAILSEKYDEPIMLESEIDDALTLCFNHNINGTYSYIYTDIKELKIDHEKTDNRGTFVKRLINKRNNK